MAEGEYDVRIAHFEAVPQSARDARHFVTDALTDWGREDLVEDAALCTSELTANAVLHARTPIELLVRQTAGGVRIEVVDQRPHDMPVPVPHHGTPEALALLRITGRGLQIVSAIGHRWGVLTSDTAKAVWVELVSGTEPTAPTAPVLGIGSPPPELVDPVRIVLSDLSVEAAVASGIQVEELIRAVHLGLADAVLTADERQAFFDLLDRSRPARLPGRHAAFRAAADGHKTFDLDVLVEPAALSATAELGRLLERIPQAMGVVGPGVSEAVRDFRRRVSREVSTQLGGERRAT